MATALSFHCGTNGFICLSQLFCFFNVALALFWLCALYKAAFTLGRYSGTQTLRYSEICLANFVWPAGFVGLAFTLLRNYSETAQANKKSHHLSKQWSPCIQVTWPFSWAFRPEKLVQIHFKISGQSSVLRHSVIGIASPAPFLTCRFLSISEHFGPV